MSEIHVHVHVHDGSPALAAALHRIERRLDLIVAQEAQEMADLAGIQSAVAVNGDAEQSAIALLNQLSQLIRDNATDQTALADLADTLDAQAADLASAVVANTPAVTPPVEPPAPPEG